MKRYAYLSVILMSILCSCNSSPSQESVNSNSTIAEAGSTTERSITAETSSTIEQSTTALLTDSSETSKESETTANLNDAGIIYENIYSKFEELNNDDEFIQLSKEEKKEILVPILDDFINSNYITEYNFNMDRHPAIVDFKFSCGGLGCYELEEHYDNEN